MARLFPDKPVGSVTPEVAKVFRVLKQLPSDWKVWRRLTLRETETPDFLLLDGQGRALLMVISSTTPQQVQSTPQMALLGLEEKRQIPGEVEEQALNDFLEQIYQAGVLAGSIPGAVLFPNLTGKDLRIVQKTQGAPCYLWLDKTWVGEKSNTAWREVLSKAPLDTSTLHVLRKAYTPEIVIPASFIARVPQTRNTAAELGDYLLDYDQEAVLKSDLDLNAMGEQLSRDFRIQIINGVTGSGKTLILLYRLRLLQEMFPQKRYLILTHNRPLIRDIEKRFEYLKPETSQQIKWYTFNGWCRKNWPESIQLWSNPISRKKREALVREVREEYLVDSNVSQGEFRSELEWVKDSGITSREDYLKADRRGRGFRLTREQRDQIFQAIRAYQKRLIGQGWMDWWDVPRRMWHWIEEGQIDPPQYDVVLIDEAQFFAPVWFNIVRRLVVPQTGYLFMAADPTQGFLRRGDSWKSVTGLDMRGRSHRLKRSYRTTRSILDCALTFYRQRLPEDEEELVTPDLSSMPPGKPPFLIRLDSPQDERIRIVNEIARALDQGMQRSHILVLSTSWRGVETLVGALNQRFGAGTACDPKDTYPGDFIRVTTINAATGLESPIVFVAGTHEMFEMEKSLRMNVEERANLVRENTRKLYMAFTRAGQRLILTHRGELPASLKKLVQNGLVLLM